MEELRDALRVLEGEVSQLSADNAALAKASPHGGAAQTAGAQPAPKHGEGKLAARAPRRGSVEMPDRVSAGLEKAHTALDALAKQAAY